MESGSGHDRGHVLADGIGLLGVVRLLRRPGPACRGEVRILARVKEIVMLISVNSTAFKRHPLELENERGVKEGKRGQKEGHPQSTFHSF